MSNNIRHKLLHYENEPPAEVWENIALSLNKEHHIPFEDRLYHFEEKPPDEVWPAIQQQLDNTQPVPALKLIFYWKKYIAAAAAFIVSVGLLFFALYKTNMLPSFLTRKEKPILQQSSASADVRHLKALSGNNSNTLSRYVLWMNEHNTVVRVSKKIYPLFTGATPLPENKFKQAQQIAAASPAGCNFTGLLDLVTSLQANQ